MKYLRDYIAEPQREVLRENGGFFAFSNGQFKEQEQQGVEYYHLGGGMFCPKANADALIDKLNEIAQSGIKADLAENGKKAIIQRELANHEYCITYDIADTSRALENYGITDDEIRAETGEYLAKYYEWEDSQEN